MARACASIVVVSDEPEKYPIGTEWAPGVTVEHRDQLDRVPGRPARDGRRDSHRLRPDLRGGKAPPAQARPLPRSAQAGVHQRPGVRRLRRLLCRLQLCLRGAGGNRVRPQAGHRPVLLQQGLFLPERLSAPASSPCTAARSAKCTPAKAQRRPVSGRSLGPNRRSRRCPASRSPTALWSPASAAPVW